MRAARGGAGGQPRDDPGPRAGRGERDPGAAGASVRRGPPDGPIDVDVADAATLDRLPGIGPALARRIVDDRAARGAFGSLEALGEVRGVGPRVLGRLAPHVVFSGPPRPPSSSVVPPAGRRRRASRSAP
ncbi:helix-hairpin-helix domain-containing protein [Roseisolibacter sp. H3M3-2]|uniref:ComEA family DNA-binding protein n=1 Tax=Roseisolibacter sp. H3M3-2 TaxID=3031323 RepID=UPI0023DC9ED8|nr:helix-hairpin-helix domain-containing protein [Roseisolibacter sp. H3M3-2]MDF1505134.1 helix-hairpin-helix domain-containing protein [Roseisolibacter sp. H3M3-2]